MLTKKCTKCKEIKDLTFFNKRVKNSDKYQSHCKSCRTVLTKAYLNQRYLIDDNFKQRKIENANKRQQLLKSDSQHIAWRRNYYLIKDFGISLKQYEEKLEKQQFSCAICSKLSSTIEERLAVDHNHVTGKVRGLLCRKCNTALGMFDADNGVGILQKAIQYIKDNDYESDNAEISRTGTQKK